MKTKDMVGKKIGRIKVIKFAYNEGSGGHSYFYCVCDCGKKIIIRGSHLREKNTKIKSCGCYSAELGRKYLKKYANSEAHKGKGNPQWKGEKAGTSSIHQWLNRHFIKKSCSIKGCKNIKLDWALLKGKRYEHRKENFIVLCRNHHLKYDYTQERKDKISKAMKKEWIKRKKHAKT